MTCCRWRFSDVQVILEKWVKLRQLGSFLRTWRWFASHLKWFLASGSGQNWSSLLDGRRNIFKVARTVHLTQLDQTRQASRIQHDQTWYDTRQRETRTIYTWEHGNTGENNQRQDSRRYTGEKQKKAGKQKQEVQYRGRDVGLLQNKTGSTKLQIMNTLIPNEWWLIQQAIRHFDNEQ